MLVMRQLLGSGAKLSRFWGLAPPVEPLPAHVDLSLATTPLWFEEQFGDNFLVTANMRVADFLNSQAVHFGKVMLFHHKKPAQMIPSTTYAKTDGCIHKWNT